MMFLIDTNIFLEVLLKQDKVEDCKSFLDKNIGNLHITDFSLHSIGIILFRYGKEGVFQRFVEDVAPCIKLLSLPMERYSGVANVRTTLNLDFDDAYQYEVAKCYRLSIATMDRDFEKIPDMEISFL
jgi:predicted nucleic acid-binding protein